MFFRCGWSLAATDSQINELAHELDGLTDEEITIVESEQEVMLEDVAPGDKLVEFAKVVKWLDDMVYTQASPPWFPGTTGFYNRRRGKWTRDENILIHWLCYIVDRQSNVKAIWTRGVDAFAGAVDALKKCGDEPKDVIEALAGLEIGPDTPSGDGDSKMLGFVCEEGRRVGFTPHYRTDKYLVVRTLCLLKPYNLSLVEFMKAACRNWSGIPLREDNPDADTMAKLSLAGHLLSYRDPKGKGKPGFVDRLGDSGELLPEVKRYEKKFSGFVRGEGLKSEFDGWKGGVHGRKPGAMYTKAKRLWCALRDDLRLNGLGHVWGTGFPEVRSLLPYLEITADVWNERFREYAVADWAKDVLRTVSDRGYDLDKIGAWEIRGLYEHLWKNGFAKEDYFPMQTDIAFDFAPSVV